MPAVPAAAAQIEFHDLVYEPVADPQVLIPGHVQKIGMRNVRPLVEVFAVLVEDLDPRVFAIADIDAPLRVDGNPVDGLELPGPDPGLPHSIRYFPSFENFTTRVLR